MDYRNLFTTFFLGLLAVTFIDTAGAVASRKFQFKYVYLSIFSFGVYIAVGGFIAKGYSLPIAFFMNTLLGVYDGTVGLWLAFVMKANTGLTSDQENALPGLQTAGYMIIVASICTMIGKWIIVA